MESMFTGIVETAGKVVELVKTANGCRFTVEAGAIAEGVQLGDSIANNGCCLTVVRIDGTRLGFDLLEETQRLTNLRNLKPGCAINLERSLPANGRLGGHFVAGHIDETGLITKWEKSGSDYELEVEIPERFGAYLIPKGCIAIDGISLTVGQVSGPRFNVWIIPHTRQVTALRERAVGDPVNLEFDLLAKYTEKILASRSGGATP